MFWKQKGKLRKDKKIIERIIFILKKIKLEEIKKKSLEIELIRSMGVVMLIVFQASRTMRYGHGRGIHVGPLDHVS